MVQHGLLLWALLQPSSLVSQERRTDAESGEQLVLPEWSKADRKLYSAEKKRFPGLGGGLWPPELYPMPTFERPPAPLAAFQADQDTNAVPELARLASQAREGKGDGASNLKFPVLSLASPAPELAPEELASPQMDLYFGQKPVDFLVDPPRLLTETQKDDVVRLLQHHARDSQIPLYLFLLDRNQRMPKGFDLASLLDCWFGETSACVLIVHLGAPRESQFMFTSSLRNEIGAHKMDQWLQECITSAQIASEPIDQVERFVAQNSLRIFWLEKMLHPLPVVNADEAQAKPPVNTAPTAIAPFFSAPTVLVNYQAPRAMAWNSFSLTGIGGAGLLAAGSLLRAWLRKSRRMVAEPRRLSEEETNAYLAAPHCGGHGASIHF